MIEYLREAAARAYSHSDRPIMFRLGVRPEGIEIICNRRDGQHYVILAWSAIETARTNPILFEMNRMCRDVEKLDAI